MSETKLQLAELSPLELLNDTFADLIAAVDQMMESQTGEDSALAAEKAGEALSAPRRVDEICALMAWYEAREGVLRGAVKVAEERARSHKAFVKHLKDSIELYMLEKGIARIEGLAHRLAVYKKPDQLIIENEDLVPEEFFDKQMVEQRTLNKERLLVALEKSEIPGCTLLRNQKRLGVR